jgi:hypothetical protein
MMPRIRCRTAFRAVELAIGGLGLALFGLAACTGGPGGATVGRSDGGPAPSTSPDGATPGPRAGDGGLALPCAVDTVFANHCRECHTDPPAFGAPMPLVTYGDLWAPAPSDPSKHVYEVVEVRIHDAAQPMPQPPNPPLDAADLATLDGWVSSGAPAGQACGAPSAPDSGVAPLPCTPDTHVAPQSAWTMPAGVDEMYVCYGFDPNVSAKRQIIAMAPHLDNTQILHHVTLLESDTAVSPVPAPCLLGGSPTWRIVFGWAPGASSFELPPEAGFPEDSTTNLVVQLHYVNPNQLTGMTDSTGFDLCTTDQLRPNDADVMAFGTVDISIAPHAVVTDTCNVLVPWWGDTTHLFAAFPHMHEIGTSISTTAFPGDGGAPVDLGSQPHWNFGEQSWIPIDDVLAPGDTVETRCSWTNSTNDTVTFGEESYNEMCYSFTMYYPKITNPEWNWALPALDSICQ